MTNKADEHQRLILEQFTNQAVPFSQMQNHSPELLLTASGAGPQDTVLDVACGPGLMACAFAKVARHVTGIDLTPAMIEQAKVMQQADGLTNLTWHVGDVQPLPFADGSFSLVFTRYSFHHFLDPKTVLAELVRVCSPGGRVVVVSDGNHFRNVTFARDKNQLGHDAGLLQRGVEDARLRGQGGIIPLAIGNQERRRKAFDVIQR